MGEKQNTYRIKVCFTDFATSEAPSYHQRCAVPCPTYPSQGKVRSIGFFQFLLTIFSQKIASPRKPIVKGFHPLARLLAIRRKISMSRISTIIACCQASIFAFIAHCSAINDHFSVQIHFINIKANFSAGVSIRSSMGIARKRDTANITP